MDNSEQSGHKQGIREAIARAEDVLLMACDHGKSTRVIIDLDEDGVTVSFRGPSNRG